MTEREVMRGNVQAAGEGLERVACVLCGSAEAEPVIASRCWDEGCREGATYQVVRCRSCGLQFLNPRPTAATLASFYPDDYYAYVETTPKPIGPVKEYFERIGWWSKRALRCAFWGYPAPGGRLRQVGRRLLLWPLWLRMVVLGKDLKVIPYAGRGRLLEVGCGKGAWLDYQRLYGFTVTGVEMSRPAVDVAHRRYRLDARAGTLEEATFPARSFDLIYMSHVFEHLPDPAVTLDEMHRVLEAGGLAILKVPNIDSAGARAFGAYWLGLDVPRHLYHFSPKTITALLRRHGFAVAAIRHDLGAWGFWRESRRLQARDGQAAPAREPWWQDPVDQLAERWACWRGQGSNIVVYVRKIEAADGRAQ